LSPGRGQGENTSDWGGVTELERGGFGFGWGGVFFRGIFSEGVEGKGGRKDEVGGG